MSFAFSKAFAPAFNGAINYNEVIVTGVPNPIVGQQVTSSLSGTLLVITSMLRYNGSGRFTCGVASLDNLFSGIMDVYYDDDAAIWKAKEYKPERYRDEEGVRLGL